LSFNSTKAVQALFGVFPLHQRTVLQLTFYEIIDLICVFCFVSVLITLFAKCSVRKFWDLFVFTFEWFDHHRA